MAASTFCKLSLSGVFAAGLACAVLLGADRAGARVEERLTYTKTQSYQTALRFLRVDHGFNVIEKDPDSGYLLFEYPKRDDGFTRGSIEVVERSESIALVIQLPQMPSYHERMLVEGLLRKLRDDYGAPPSHKSPPKEPEEGDKPEEKPEPPPGSSDDESPDSAPHPKS